MRRVIGEVRPAWVLAENVAGHITLGLDQVLADLEADGYAGRAIVVPACAKDAPHIRQRIWIMACDRDRGRESTCAVDDETQGMQGAVADSDRARLEGRERGGVQERASERVAGAGGASNVGNAERPPAHVLTTAADPAQGRTVPTRQPSWWEPEPAVGRVANGIPRRMDRLRCLGNAVVPQVVEEIGRAIMAASRGE